MIIHNISTPPKLLVEWVSLLPLSVAPRYMSNFARNSLQASCFGTRVAEDVAVLDCGYRERFSSCAEPFSGSWKPRII